MKKGFQSVAIDQLVKADWNYKEDNAELLEKLVNNIKRNGQIENIIIRELDTGFLEVVNGNHRLDALKVIGAEEVYCFNLGTISEAQAKRIAVETNETKFSSNQDNLSAILLDLVDDFDIEDLLDTMPFDEFVFIGAENYEPEVEGQEEEEEEIPEPEIIQTKIGDLYELNGHKLLCGDCTKKESVLSLFGEKVANLIVIDPPYGVDYAEKNKLLNRAEKISGKVYGTRMEREIKNDNIENYLEFFKDSIQFVPLAEYNSLYAFMSSQNLHNLRVALDEAGFYFSSYLVWLKNNHVIGWMDYSFKTEFICYGWKGKHKFYGSRGTPNVIEFDKPISSKLHPTMKPTGLVKLLIENNSLEGEIVYDGFCGSGTTIMASEESKRTCYAIELDEKYCDVSVLRWVRYMKSHEFDFCVKLNGVDISSEEWINAE